ncbi:hypothetical protein BN946_scf184908.g160 [Trametes cinnabarina]|uniref:Phosphatase n=1 Tax=Pycnoporus cinnabarinus TaxID=5643 RepID=A0A060SA85_PYCCI|nr:hypothetical protein BN946_scf184908.g160 [Trametes cinnabarina]
MDGTLVDSTDGVVGAWELFAYKYPGLDVTQVLSSSHGVRTVENLRLHCGITDPDELEIGPLCKLPKPRWAICTSATSSYATAALQAAGVPVPDVFVVSEDVEKGKPEPDPYLLGAKRCGVDPSRCLVVEDAPAGVRSGKAAGCKTLALITSHTREQIAEAQPDYVVSNLSRVTMKPVDNGIEVTIQID